MGVGYKVQGRRVLMSKGQGLKPRVKGLGSGATAQEPGSRVLASALRGLGSRGLGWEAVGSNVQGSGSKT
eukprot:3941204-Rhodomonas_salina.1